MKYVIFTCIAIAVFLTGCKFSASVDPNLIDGDTTSASTTSSTTNETQYDVQITNFTFNQKFSNASYIFHKNALSKEFTPGSAVKSSIEELCEIGNNQKWLSDALLNTNVYTTRSGLETASHTTSNATTVTISATSDIYLTWGNMLVNTNDGFTGLTHIQMNDLNVGESKIVDANAFDCGTEFNFETPSTMSGPHGDQSTIAKAVSAAAATDEGFLSIHRGVITSSDGLANSVLDHTHFFNNPVAQVKITRLK
ncbi:MAG: spondin domain-containing protein [Candidatus Cloacimonetes bacterium]|nr:spondin domain-containing protein [Candidatus Cloacimonadota bacterium]